MTTTTTGVLEQTMLVKVDVGENNNKFYEVTLYDSGLVTKRWGRVGASSGQHGKEQTGKAGYDKLVASKKRRGYSPVDLVTAPQTKRVNDLVGVAQKRVPTDPSDATLKKLVAEWCAANRHNIETTSGGLITVSSTGVVSTALGIVGPTTISNARTVLNKIDAAKTLPVKLIEEYLTLIPQKLGRDRGWEETFAKPETISRQRDFLDSLDGSLAVAASLASGDETDAEFRYQLTHVDHADKAFAEIKQRFDKSKNNRHTSSRLQLKNLYEVSTTRDDEPQTWKTHADTLKNVRRLWHGTRDCNLISILHRGLYVPPTSGGTVQVTGRMFGDGIYFSDQSTKSLNYSQGYWSGGARTDRCFMLMADVVMGTPLKPSTYGSAAVRASRNGKYHSIDVRGGTCGVLNNEMIVWNTNQIRISYICEFDK